MKTHNLAFIDVETTGLDPDRHELIEIGCVLARQIAQEGKGPALLMLDEFECKIMPEHLETADPESLAIIGFKKENWADAIPLAEAMEKFSERVRGASFVAHNAFFDYAFIEHAFKKTGVKNFMHYHRLDTVSIAFAKLYDKTEVEKFSLRFLCEYFGVENKNAHTALSDARATFEVYKRLMTDNDN
ncbi:MAG: 3'-5' exonuclease [Candidatus Paceibacterota bacterium]|jgi:DNA polymerase III epsilon subunit family exonuclease|nr:3'-5' exonuclease [Candidatus Paceibacterota bacterium]